MLRSAVDLLQLATEICYSLRPSMMLSDGTSHASRVTPNVAWILRILLRFMKFLTVKWSLYQISRHICCNWCWRQLIMMHMSLDKCMWRSSVAMEKLMEHCRKAVIDDCTTWSSTFHMVHHLSLCTAWNGYIFWLLMYTSLTLQLMFIKSMLL